jgi:hypothetical protein
MLDIQMNSNTSYSTTLKQHVGGIRIAKRQEIIWTRDCKDNVTSHFQVIEDLQFSDSPISGFVS